MPRVVLGITGGIAAYRAADIARQLSKNGIDVVAVMSESAKEFITPLTIRTLTNNPVYSDMFHTAKEPGSKIEHIDLARNCDLILVAPATANFIGKVASGIADDLLTTTVMASEKPVALAPAMNKAMWENPIVAENVRKLKKAGYVFIGPKKGGLACGEYGAGHIEDTEEIVRAALAILKKKIKSSRVRRY
ncbi:MAG TPA: flavoprotein [Candidatus Goldiibacteriota bacterium]|nr:flavoprotein [Candidatus Goldiibacteriota bacterium]